MTNRKVLWITQTAVLTALLIVTQAVTASLGNTLVTGSMVNLILIVAVMLAQLSSGLTVAAISPIFAKFLGIGPLWSLIPFIVIGNMVLVWVWHLLGNRKFGKPAIGYIIALVAAAIGKFLALYIGVVQIAVPYLLQLPDPQAVAISGMFSIPQLVTASIGGALAVIILPLLKKAAASRL